MIGYILTEIQATQIEDYIHNLGGQLADGWTVNLKTNLMLTSDWAVFDNIANALTEKGFDWEDMFFQLTGVRVNDLEHRNIKKSELVQYNQNG